MERDIGEHRHLREQHAEADGKRGPQLTVADERIDLPRTHESTNRSLRNRLVVFSFFRDEVFCREKGGLTRGREPALC